MKRYSVLAGLYKTDAREPDEAPNATAAALQVFKSRRAELDRLAAKLDAEERTTLVEGEFDARADGDWQGTEAAVLQRANGLILLRFSRHP
jgi:uncharacterized tellurite resistance protein B-like protein